MRTAVALSALLTLAVLAGCTTSKSTHSTTTAQPALAGWSLDCNAGSFEAAKAAWNQTCESRASHTPGQKQEVWLAANPTDPNNIVVGAKDLNPAASAHCVWNGLFTTHDGGKTWKDIIIGGEYAARSQSSPYYGYACNTDPMGVFTADGTLYWVVELYNFAGKDGNGPLGADPTSGRGIVQPGWKLVLAPSHDGGLTFPDAEAVTLEYGDGIGLLNDYSRVTVNPATQSVLTVINSYYPGFGANAALIPVSIPANTAGEFCSILSFRGAGAPVQVVPIQPTAHTGTANPGEINCLSINANDAGTVVLGAVGSAGVMGGPLTAWFASSKDDGANFADFKAGFTYTPIPGKFAESAYRTGTGFEAAYDNAQKTTAYADPAVNHTTPNHGRLYVITAEQTAKDEADILVRSSDDDGATWSDPVRVNQDSTTAHQFMPNIVVASDGSVHAFWMDKAYDTAHNHTFIDITHGVSSDGGKTWKTERVTTQSWNGELGKHQEGFPFIGDYTGIGASGDVVWGAFPDASNGKTTVIATARVTLS